MDTVTRRLIYFSNREPVGITAEKDPASCSIPLWYEPTTIEGHTYLDGGVIANTPFRKALELGATEVVVAVMVPLPGAHNPRQRHPRARVAQ